jgi:hypothetical protein
MVFIVCGFELWMVVYLTPALWIVVYFNPSPIKQGILPFKQLKKCVSNILSIYIWIKVL